MGYRVLLWGPPAPQSRKLSLGEKSQGNLLSYLFDSPRGTSLWSSPSIAPLSFYSVRCLCLCVRDVSLTQVNGRKFFSAFKCIAFFVLSKNTLFLGKNIFEAFGIKSTELWPLMEFEALRGVLIRIHFCFFLLDYTHFTQ